MLLEAYFEGNPLKSGTTFNHFRPARYFSEKVTEIEGAISATTLSRFEEVFKHGEGT
jgi:hypothetical protein